MLLDLGENSEEMNKGSIFILNIKRTGFMCFIGTVEAQSFLPLFINFLKIYVLFERHS